MPSISITHKKYFANIQYDIAYERGQIEIVKILQIFSILN